MRAITICQPWAELIVGGEKRVENRSWTTGYRGPLAIHAGRSRVWMEKCPDAVPADRELPFGAIVGLVDLVKVIRFSELESYSRNVPGYEWLRTHVYASGPLCWILANARRFERPIPWRGSQRLWNVPDRVIERAVCVASC